MGNIISNCCSNSLIFSVKNYFCGQQNRSIRVNFARGEIFYRPQLIFLNGFTATNGASPSLQGSCLTHSNLR
jgi:hypothetical protein